MSHEVVSVNRANRVYLWLFRNTRDPVCNDLRAKIWCARILKQPQNAASIKMKLRFKRDEAAFRPQNAASEAAFAPRTLRPFL